MAEHSLVFSIFLIFVGAAVLSTFALLTRQSMLVAYILLGVLLGPFGLKLINDTEVVKAISDVGIIFLLFLLGLSLPPQKLALTFKKVAWIAVVSSVIFGGIGYWIASVSGYTVLESLIVGAAMMFSSTIIGIKLLPTTILHHQHTGEVMISVLLLQDLIAITVLLVMRGIHTGGFAWKGISLVVFGFPAILLFAYVCQRFVLLRLFSHFNHSSSFLNNH